MTAKPTMYYVIGAIVIIIAVLAAIAIARRARSSRLQHRFGREYDRVARDRGSRAEGERELARREERIKKFRLQELPPGARDRYGEEWRRVQARFVDERPRRWPRPTHSSQTLCAIGDIPQPTSSSARKTYLRITLGRSTTIAPLTISRCATRPQRPTRKTFVEQWCITGKSLTN